MSVKSIVIIDRVDHGMDKFPALGSEPKQLQFWVRVFRAQGGRNTSGPFTRERDAVRIANTFAGKEHVRRVTIITKEMT